MIVPSSPHTGRNVAITILLILILYVISTFFYHKFEGWQYLDAVYFITMTITTIGYGDLVPTTPEGKIFTIFLAFIGIALAFLLIASIGSYKQRTIDRHVIGRFELLKNISSLAKERKGSKKIKNKLEGAL